MNGAVVWNYTSKYDAAYVAHTTFSCGVFMHSRCQLIETFVNKEVTRYFSPISCLLKLILSS